jgi:hypothetical protein
MDWLIDLFKDLQRCIKGLADRIKEDSDDDYEDNDSNDDTERMNGELKDSDDDVDERIKRNLISLVNQN